MAWEFSQHGRVKLNTDGSVILSKGGGGGVLRDETASFLFGFAEKFGEVDPLQVEAKVLLYGCKFVTG